MTDSVKRKNRVPFMLSDEELLAIDDYRYANRIATRARAIRQLIMLQLTREHAISEMTKIALAVAEASQEEPDDAA